MIESKNIEYKQRVTPELEKEVVAFLNANEGGFIYIGIDKTGKTIGVPDPDAVQLELKDRFKNNILPSCMGLFDILLEKRDDKNIVKIIVAGGYEKPYYIKKYGLSEKGAFIRIGSASEPMPSRQIEELFTKRTRYSIGKIRLQGVKHNAHIPTTKKASKSIKIQVVTIKKSQKAGKTKCTKSYIYMHKMPQKAASFGTNICIIYQRCK